MLILAERPDFAGEHLVAFISSRTTPFDPAWDILLDPTQPRDASTRLRVPSVLRTTKVTIIAGSAMAGRLGVVNNSVLRQARERLLTWLST